ncbi:hypothetical protein TNCV_4247881 [Trichonephila clavipes]|nr:hypothetical protein TNCV_4247881 [Trichonephila clavipes]
MEEMVEELKEQRNQLRQDAKRNIQKIQAENKKEPTIGNARGHPGPYKVIEVRPRDRTATAGSDVVQSGRPIFDDFFQHLWPYIGNNTANVVFQMVKRLWLIRIDP